MADTVLSALPSTQRKCEHLITELVRQRDLIHQLKNKISLSKDFEWLHQM